MNVSWKDTIVLLRNECNTARICCSVIKEVMTVKDVPDIFHELITSFLTASSTSTRYNSGMMLKVLCSKFREDLHPLLSEMHSDGDLVNISKIDVVIIAQDEQLGLYSKPSSHTVDGRSAKLYKKDWLKFQRQQLSQRLGIEFETDDARTAVNYTDIVGKILTENDIDDTAVGANQQHPDGVQSVYSKVDICGEVATKYSTYTDENWFTRLMRYLIVGVMDTRWETRHGCCIGLQQILSGLFPRDISGTISEQKQQQQQSNLAPFLLSDILIMSVCLLGLDRFVDCDVDDGANIDVLEHTEDAKKVDQSEAEEELDMMNSDVSTPVKDIAGKVIYVSLSRLADTDRGAASSDRIALLQWTFNSLLGLCNATTGHWSVRMGGLVGMRHIICLLLKKHNGTSISISHVITVLLCVVRDVFRSVGLVEDLYGATVSLFSELVWCVDSLNKDVLSDCFVSKEEVIGLVNTVSDVLRSLTFAVTHNSESVDFIPSYWIAHVNCVALFRCISELSVVKSSTQLSAVLWGSVETALLTAIELSHSLHLCSSKERNQCFVETEKSISLLLDILILTGHDLEATNVDLFETYKNVFRQFVRLFCTLIAVCSLSYRHTSASSNDSKCSSSHHIGNNIVNTAFRSLGRTLGKAFAWLLSAFQLNQSSMNADMSVLLNTLCRVLLVHEAVTISVVTSTPVGQQATPIDVSTASTKSRKRKTVSVLQATKKSQEDMSNMLAIGSVGSCSELSATIVERYLSGIVWSNDWLRDVCSEGVIAVHDVYHAAHNRASITQSVFDRQSRLDFALILCGLMTTVHADKTQSSIMRGNIVQILTDEVAKTVAAFVSSQVNKVDVSVVKKPRAFKFVVVSGNDAVSLSSHSSKAANSQQVGRGGESSFSPQEIRSLIEIEGLIVCAIFLMSETDILSAKSHVTAIINSLVILNEYIAKYDIGQFSLLTTWLQTLCIDNDDTRISKLLQLVGQVADVLSPRHGSALAEIVARDMTHMLSLSFSTVPAKSVIFAVLLNMLRLNDDEAAAARLVFQCLSSDMQQRLLASDEVSAVLDGSQQQQEQLARIRLLHGLVPQLNTTATLSFLLSKYDVVTIVLTDLMDCDIHNKECISDSVELVAAILYHICNHGDSTLSVTTLRKCAAEMWQLYVSSDSRIVLRRALLAVLHQRLTELLKEKVLSVFEIWFGIALQGLGDFNSAVRVPSTAVFRDLVPLAPLAASAAAVAETNVVVVPSDIDNTHKTHGNIAMSQLFGRRDHYSVDTMSHIDERIKESLLRETNLLNALNSEFSTATPAYSVSALNPNGLRHYQWEGVTWLTQLRRCGVGGILADEMGLGKSLQALTAIAVMRIEKNCVSLPSLIVCPASLVLHWEQEMDKFFPTPLIRPRKVTKSSMSNDLSQVTGSDVVIVSYDALRSNIDKFQRIVWEYIVLDEAHLIKNPQTATAKAIFTLRGKCRMALTGTPVQNQVEELWSLMHFLIPDYLGEYSGFRKKSVLPILRAMNERQQLKERERSLLMSENNNNESDVKNDKKSTLAAKKALNKFNQSVEVSAEGLVLLRLLHKQVLPFVLRRTKAKVASELPPKTIVDILCPLSTVQRHLYATFQTGLSLSDETLAMELQAVKDNKHVRGDDKVTALSRTERDDPQTILTLDAVGFDDNEDDIALGSNNGFTVHSAGLTKGKKLHPLQALTYLKLLSVHPALVVSSDHASYRQRLLSSPDSSGKLLHLARLLLDSGVVLQEEFRSSDDFMSLFGIDDTSTRVANDSDDNVDDENQVDSGDSNGEENKSTTATSAKRPTRKPANAADRVKPGGKPNPVQQQLGDSEAMTVNVISHRCLIFAQHKSALDLIESLILRKYCPTVRYERLDGDVPPVRRAVIAKRFNDQQFTCNRTDSTEPVDLRSLLPSVVHSEGVSKTNSECIASSSRDDIRILLMTTSACGLGLNLTAADTVIFVEHSWNPFVDLQAMDRVHRIGQTVPVTIYRLLAESTIEARIVGLQGVKQSVANEVINDENTGGLTSSTAADGDSSRRGFEGMLWDSLTIFKDQQQARSEADEREEEEFGNNLDLNSFLKSVGH